MTLPGSGQLDYNSIRAEFAGPSSNVTLSTYVRGSSFTYPVPANASIPTGSTSSISVSNFYGAKGNAKLASFTASQTSSGGKLPTTFRGANAGGWIDASGYWGSANVGNWTLFRSETNFSVDNATATWTSSIPLGVAATATVYNSSGTQAAQIIKSSTHGIGSSNTQNPGPAPTQWSNGIGGTDVFGSKSPGGASWPTSGVHYLDGG